MVDMMGLLVLLVFRFGDLCLGLTMVEVGLVVCWLKVVLVMGACSDLVPDPGCVPSGEPAMVLGLLDRSWTAGGDGVGDRVMMLTPGVDGDSVRLLSDGARGDTVMPLIMVGDTVMPLCMLGVGDKVMMSGCLMVPLCLVGEGDMVMMLGCLLVAWRSLTSVLACVEG